MSRKENATMERRAFLARGSLCLAGAATFSCLNSLAAETDEPLLRIALMSDVHYAEKEPRINRYYQESPEKLAAAASEYVKHKPDFVVELGDFIDAGSDLQEDRKHLRKIDAVLKTISDDRHHVLGNHCVELLTKGEFLGEVEQEKSYYSFDRKGWHFVILDACFRKDGIPYGRKNADWRDTIIPEREIEWLADDLKNTSFPTIVMLHQRLDLENTEAHTVKNADRVRRVLEASGRVRLVLQGHDHRGGYNEIGGIHYCTLSAMIEGSGLQNNAFSLLEIDRGGDMKLTGFVKQGGRIWKNSK